jgi:hypothetical protein
MYSKMTSECTCNTSGEFNLLLKEKGAVSLVALIAHHTPTIITYSMA